MKCLFTLIILYLSMSLLMLHHSVSSAKAKWGLWSEWACDRTCGTGVAMRTRICKMKKKYQKRPKKKQPKCYGKRRKTKKCAMIPCSFSAAIGESSVSNRPSIIKHLRNMHYNFETYLGSNVSMPCDHEVTTGLVDEFENATISWLKNHQSLTLNKSRMKVQNGVLGITPLIHNDTGVYLCQVFWGNGSRQTVGVYAVSLVNVTEASFIPRVGDRVEFHCNSITLGLVYRNLQQTWFHDGVVFKNYEYSTPQDVNVLRLHNVTRQVAGLWECVVSQPKSNRVWVTNRFRVDVLSALTWVEMRLRDPVIVLGLVMIVVGIIGTFVTGLFYKPKKHSGITNTISTRSNTETETVSESETNEESPCLSSHYSGRVGDLVSMSHTASSYYSYTDSESDVMLEQSGYIDSIGVNHLPLDDAHTHDDSIHYVTRDLDS